MKKVLLFAFFAFASLTIFCQEKPVFVMSQLIKLKDKGIQAIQQYVASHQKIKNTPEALTVISYRFKAGQKYDLSKIEKQFQELRSNVSEQEINYVKALACYSTILNDFENGIKFFNVLKDVNYKKHVAKLALGKKITVQQEKVFVEFLKNNKDYDRLMTFYIFKKDKNNIWTNGILLFEKIQNAKKANDTVIAMFKNKPKTITKEQQIKFLQQLADKYPTPGTDFNQWKSFMGFIGYRYKVLTGKDLFPVTK